MLLCRTQTSLASRLPDCIYVHEYILSCNTELIHEFIIIHASDCISA